MQYPLKSTLSQGRQNDLHVILDGLQAGTGCHNGRNHQAKKWPTLIEEGGHKISWVRKSGWCIGR
jgi:hypothetical protein